MTRLNDAWLDAFAAIGKKEPPAKKLAMLLKPAFVAPKGKTFVWGDWSNIEARVLPWLAASPGAEAKLDIFRETDKDDRLPGVYVRTAAALTDQDPVELQARYKAKDKEADDIRQAYGKVPELSLGFGGGLGALLAMAATYGVYLDTKTATRVVETWRNENGWARSFWGKHGREGSYGLWGAANSAMEDRGTVYAAGRVAYVYDHDYLGGTLFCALPSGRLLTYPAIRWEKREVEDKATGKLVDRYQLTYKKGYGRAAAWYGKLAENVTQAEAASVLRRTLKRLDRDFFRTPEGAYSRYSDALPVVMHTHDEVLTEVDDWVVANRNPEALLKECMERNDAWDEGLPLAAETKQNWYYSKAV